jgi:hypothetical protein
MLLDMPSMPIDRTRSSTRRVETPSCIGLADHRDERLLGAASGLEERGHVGATP